MSDTRTIKIFPQAIDPSQIESGSFTISIGTVNYYKVGKLYFGFHIMTVNGLFTPFIDDTGILDTVAQLATELGITVNTSYKETYTTGGTCVYSSSGTWHLAVYATNLEAIYAILAN